MKKIFLVVLAMGLIMFGSVGTPGATPITGGPTGLTNPDMLVTFDELGNLQNQEITDQFIAYGVTFENFGWDNATQGQGGSTGFSGGDLVNGFPPFPTGKPAVISFTEDVNSAVFAAVDSGVKWDISAWLDGVLVESFDLNVSLFPGVGYIGFSDIIFDEIQLSSSGALTIDNLQYNFAAVPEPGTMLLFGFGLLGVAVVNRRKPAA